MTKDIGLLIAIPPDLKAWVDAQAEDIGLNAEIWIRMLVFQARKRRAGAAQEMPPPVQSGPTEVWSTGWGEPATGPYPRNDDAWRGPTDDEPPDITVDVEAMIANRVAEAESAGLTQSAAQPYEAFAAGPPPSSAGASNVRSLRRPPPQFSPSLQPGHLRNL